MNRRIALDCLLICTFVQPNCCLAPALRNAHSGILGSGKGKLSTQLGIILMEKYVLSIDQGTTSTRAIVFDESGSVISTGQLEHKQIMTKPGWVEHDPMEIWGNAREVIGTALSRANITRHDIAAVGITNQRETTIVWNKTTGKPVYNAIVWQDTRTQDIVEPSRWFRRRRSTARNYKAFRLPPSFPAQKSAGF